MEIKLNLGIRTVLQIIGYLKHMDIESVIWSIISTLLTPFLMYSLWEVGFTIIWQLFWLGVKAGFLLVIASFVFLFLIRCNETWKRSFLRGEDLANWKRSEENGKPKCTLLDVILSMIFQLGLWIPETIWYPLVDIVLGKRKDNAPVEIKAENTLEKQKLYWDEMTSGVENRNTHGMRTRLQDKVNKEAVKPMSKGIKKEWESTSEESMESGSDSVEDLYGYCADDWALDFECQLGSLQSMRGLDEDDGMDSSVKTTAGGACDRRRKKTPVSKLAMMTSQSPASTAKVVEQLVESRMGAKSNSKKTIRTRRRVVI